MNSKGNNTESEEQIFLFRWSVFASGKYPELNLLYHIPNEGKRSKSTGGRMKAEGLKKGVPDLCLPVARGKYHALYIEMKATGGKLSKDQQEWLNILNNAGNLAVMCVGWDMARAVIEEYLKIK